MAALLASSAPSYAKAESNPVFQVFDFNNISYDELNPDPPLEAIENNRLAGVRPYNQGYEVRRGEGRRGSTAAYCDNSSGGKSMGLSWSFTLSQSKPEIVRMQGWSKAKDVQGNPDSNYSLYIDLVYTDGAVSWGHSTPFDAGSHDWRQETLLVIPEKPIERISCYALFRNKKGQAWFDDVSIQQAAAQPDLIRLDGIFVQKNDVSPPIDSLRSLHTHDMDVTVNPSNGAVASMAVKRTAAPDASMEEIPLNKTGDGFLLRDVKRGSDYFSFDEGTCEPLDCRLELDIVDREEAVHIYGKLQSGHDSPRAMNLLYALPIDALGEKWGDHISQARTLSKPEDYHSWVEIGAGANGQLSRYPFACVYSNTCGAALGIDMGKPCQWRLGYSTEAGILYLSMDFGLHPETQNFPSAAEFHIVLYAFDPSWGFRAALDRYYQIFPAYFEVRSKDQGIWMPFTDVSTVEGWSDFGFKYHEGTNNIPFDDDAGILSFRYTEPSTWWMNMPKETPRTYEAAMEQVHRYAEDSNSRPSLRRNALALLSSGFHDENGRYRMLFRNEPWANGAVFSLNPNPDLPGEVTEASMLWNDELARRLYGEDARGIQDGEYLDSLEAYVTADLNYRVDHFRYTTTPLTFTMDSRAPVIHKAFSQCEFTRRLSEDMHARGKLLFANSVPYRFSFLCPPLDVMGTETNWVRNGKFAPDGEATMNYRRSLVGGKPYLFLMNTNFEYMTYEIVERYFQRCLFYGMHPSMFSHNAAEDPYWKNPALYNRDRPLFKTYIPLIKQIAEAGWRPVTRIRAGEEALRIERFGGDQENGIYITAMNPTSQTLPLKLKGEGSWERKGRWTELLSNQAGEWNGGLTASIEAGAVHAYRISLD